MPPRGRKPTAIIPAGLGAPGTPSAAQLEAVDRLVWDNVHAIEALEPVALRSVLPVLRHVRDELRRDLAAWLVTAPDGAERYTAQRMRVALRSVEAAIATAQRLEPEMHKALRFGDEATGYLAASSLDNEIARFGSMFGESIRPVNIEAAAIVARGDQLLFKHHKVSAARYAGQVGDDIRHQLAVGVAKGETFAQLKARLVKMGGPAGRVMLRGREGDPNALAAVISEGLFQRHRYWAERLVRTELMHAYNLQHRAGIELLNSTLGPDEAPFVRRWNAAADRRVCPFCRALDNTTAPIEGPFQWGIMHPPAHPNCRCVEVAWHPSWGDIEGERAAKGPIPSKLPAGFGRGPASPNAPIREGIPTRRRLSERAIYVFNASDLVGRIKQLEAGMQEGRRQRIAEGWASGRKLDPVKLVLMSDGSIEVADGRHRIEVAISQGRRIAARISRGV